MSGYEGLSTAVDPFKGLPGGNSHSNLSAIEIAPGEVRVSFDNVYSADPPGSTITEITVSP